jgi:branched-chain amino acid transport system ATP-binding protein
MSVLENVMVGSYRFGAKEEAARAAQDVLSFLGLSHLSRRLARELNTPEMKRLEIARALSTRPKLLLLDEVMSGLTPTESRALIPTIRRIRERGITIVMIEHVMHAVMTLSDRIFVLHHGEALAQGRPEEIAANPVVIEAYLGLPAEAETRHV